MKTIIFFLFSSFIITSTFGQIADSSQITNKDEIYNRPFILNEQNNHSSVAIGGYIEANTNYFETNGISEGFSAEMRRFNIFLFSSIHDRIKFLSELEFEHGTEEIALETALLDFELNTSFNIRAGIVLVPLGYFNQNHDSPKWEFIDRPLVSTHLIPATYSDVGFGFHGLVSLKNYSFTYETYLINGLQDRIIANAQDRTFLPSGKNEERFGEDNNGSPAITARIAFKKRKAGEIGFSSYFGSYNKYKIEGLSVDEKRTAFIAALDYNLDIKPIRWLGEIAFAHVEVPDALGPNFGSKQWGLHTDIIYPVFKGTLLSWQNTVLNISARYEFVDYNIGKFPDSDEVIKDHLHSLLLGVSLRFSTNTLLKLNYRLMKETDLVGNPATKTAGIQFGFASYF